MAQTPTTDSASLTSTPSTLATLPFTTSAPSVPSTTDGIAIGTSISYPSFSDDAGSGGSPTSMEPPSAATATSAQTSSGNGMTSHDDLINYYFVFLAIIICIIGLLGFLVWRRKRKAIVFASFSRQNALAQDLDAWGRPNGANRYWPGRWRSAEASREEGLNEEGEAPPPYVPKATPEAGEAQVHQLGPGHPALPLQTLSRDDTGLKPPDYTEANVRRASLSPEPGEASSSRPLDLPDGRRSIEGHHRNDTDARSL